jgi:hypothetical protein
MSTYRVEVQTAGDGDHWSHNAIVYQSVTEAAAYARDLFMRWTAVREWRVTNVETGEVMVRS